MPILPKKNNTSKSSYDKHRDSYEEEEDERYSERNMRFGDTSGKSLDDFEQELKETINNLNNLNLSLDIKKNRINELVTSRGLAGPKTDEETSLEKERQEFELRIKKYLTDIKLIEQQIENEKESE